MTGATRYRILYLYAAYIDIRRCRDNWALVLTLQSTPGFLRSQDIPVPPFFICCTTCRSPTLHEREMRAELGRLDVMGNMGMVGGEGVQRGWETRAGWGDYRGSGKQGHGRGDYRGSGKQGQSGSTIEGVGEITDRLERRGKLQKKLGSKMMIRAGYYRKAKVLKWVYQRRDEAMAAGLLRWADNMPKWEDWPKNRWRDHVGNNIRVGERPYRASDNRTNCTTRLYKCIDFEWDLADTEKTGAGTLQSESGNKTRGGT